jgi:proteasome lid subunit RPN8/RPN11
MSDVPDPQEALESPDFEPALPGDKRIIFGARKPTEEASPLTGIPLLIEAPFPHERTLHWWPLARWNEEDVVSEVSLDDALVHEDEKSLAPFVSAGGNTAVVVSQEVLIKVNEHVGQTLDRELGGFLLGNRYRCPTTGCDYVIVDQYSPAKFTESSEVRLNFTHEAWAQLSDELSGKFLGKLLIGWYHSHPRLDVFLSSHDMEIQTERFPEPWTVALVLEPEKHLGGFFCAREGRVNPNAPVDFFELLERNSKKSVIAWGNHKAFDPSMNSTLVLSPTNTEGTSAPELPEISEAKISERVPVRKKRKGKRFFAAAVVLILMSAIAVGIANRKRIKAWLQARNIVSTPSPQPAPAQSVEQQQQAPTNPGGHDD